MLYYMVIETININVFTADVACVYVRLRYEIWKWEAVKESIKVGNNIQHTEFGKPFGWVLKYCTDDMYLY
jgi:hypothetical protein